VSIDEPKAVGRERVHRDVGCLHDEVQPATGADQARQRRDDRIVTVRDAAQERSPREMDRHLPGDADEGVREALDRRDDEQDVRGPPPQGRAGAIREPVGARVERDDQRVRIGTGGRQREVTVTRADVDDRASVRPRQPVELTDVDLGESPSRERSHRTHATGRTG
jgi:hypothetical protein